MKKLTVLVGVLLLVGFVEGRPALGGDATTDYSPGKESYKRNCAVCHGDRGLGDGLAAKFLFPKPRNFSDVMFKIRSTSSGDVPTDENLFSTITNGMPGSAMPSFSYLPERERSSLVEYIKTFGTKRMADKEINLWEIRGTPHVIKVPPQPEQTAELLARGEQLYFDENIACRECHGKNGRGDGPKASSLKDDWGYPIVPNDFTRSLSENSSF